MPKVSVIIPTYNRAHYVQRAIRSVLDQTFQNFEIVLVDDASTDDSPKVVKSFNDERIHYFRHDSNRREAATRNTGVRNSVGDYIAFLDDDDWWLPQKLEMQIKLFEKSSSQLGVVYTSFLEVDRESGLVLGTWYAEKRGDIHRDLSEQNWIGIPSTVVVRRQCFEKLGLFDEQIDFGLDYDMWVRIARVYDFEYLKEPLVLRPVYHERLSTNSALVLRGAEAKLKKYAEYFAINSEAFSRRLLRMGVLYCYNGDMRTGRRTFLKAIRLNPLEMRNYYNLALSFLGAQHYRRIKDFRDRMACRPRFRTDKERDEGAF